MQSPALSVIAGLGNPGPTYRLTRHNVGFMAVEALAGAQGFERRGESLVKPARLGPHHVLVVQPQTFMNRSGAAIRELLEERGLTPRELLVLYDDVEIPFGHIRVRERGSDGGHNGMKSICAELGSTEVARVRIGIGRGVEGDLVDHVLSELSGEERVQLPAILTGVSEAVLLCLAGQTGKAMSLFNRRDLLPPREAAGGAPEAPSS